jgi:hypothetical protein
MPKNIADATIISGASQSNTVSLNEGTLTGFIITGSVVTGTTISFLVSFDGTNFYPLYDNENSEVTITTASFSRAYSFNPVTGMPWNFIKARLGTSASAVNQQTYDAGVQFITET